MQTVEKEIQDINSRHNSLNTKHESLSRTVQGIAATGGASIANNVTYNNSSSGLNAENAQDAIDEIISKKFENLSYLSFTNNSKANSFILALSLNDKMYKVFKDAQPNVNVKIKVFKSKFVSDLNKYINGIAVIISETSIKTNTYTEMWNYE